MRVKRWPIWESLDKTGECWLWLGSVGSHGYGQVRKDGGPKLVHRVAYEEACGPIPPGLVVDHKCSNRLCCRPDHLHVVTTAENNRLTMERGRARRSHCKHGHEFTSENTYTIGARRYCRACGVRRSVIWRRKDRQRKRAMR